MTLRAAIWVSLCVLSACNDGIDVPADGVDAFDAVDAVDVAIDVTLTDAGSCCAIHKATCGTLKACPGAICGACGAGETCNSGNTCSKDGKALRQFGEPCGPDLGCRPPVNATDASALAAFHSCLNGQCADGMCDLGVCTKSCAIQTDSMDNATGATGADGIEDAKTSACDAAVNGPWGTHFTCVQLNPAEAKSAECLPESDFKPCHADADCSAGDACLIQFIYGHLRTICGPAMRTPVSSGTYKPGGKLGAACNGDLASGDLALCANNFCSGGFCFVPCTGDGDCATQKGACSSGKCAGGKVCQKDSDCSAYFCKADVAYASDFSLSVCAPKDCAVDGDCGPGAFCRPYWNGVKTSEGAAFTPQCQTIGAGTVTPGSACDPYATNPAATQPGALCQNPYACVDGSCGSLCQKDSDCAVDQKCGVQEFVLDVSDPQDGVPDVSLALNLCAYLPKAAGTCAGQMDCSSSLAAYCKPFLHKLALPADATPIGADTPTGADTLSGLCVAPDGNAALVGEACGPVVNDTYCASGYCLNTVGPGGIAQAGYCADMCNGRSDCPGSIFNGGAVYKSWCRSIRVGQNGTLSDDRDDLWLPFCQPTAATNTLQDCSATKKCGTFGEQCTPAVIAMGPDVTATVEYVCMGVDASANKGAGEACDPKSAAAQCKSPVGCLSDASGGGYCSALCQKDADCGVGMFCDVKYQLLPRVEASKAAVVAVCRKKP
jgi:hypothetical protein